MQQQELYAQLKASPVIRKTAFMLFAFIFLSSPSFAADEPAAPEIISVGAETYTEPKFKSMSPPDYPRDARRFTGEEGWVYVQMMIDPTGKPYELEVVDSTGNKDFEREALKAFESAKFVPATLGGKPVDAAVVLPIFFDMLDNSVIRPAFKKGYESFVKTVDAQDKAAAETALSGLKATNLYERAFLGMAKYSYARLWGTDKEQLAGLNMAVGGMTTPKYLTKNVFVFALRAQYVAQIEAKDYAAATATWTTLQRLDNDPESIAKLRPIAASVEAMRTDPRTYSVPGTLTEGTWAYGLFRNRFHINVVDGHVSQIKLYCEKKYVLFLFDPKLEYKVEDKFGKCSIVVIGDAGTNIELVQKAN